MSTRWYPIYQKGNPQLRVFLPNFWLKLIRPIGEQPPNVVTFACSMEMTRFDIKNYLEKIYKIDNIVEVRTRIDLGKTEKSSKGYIIKKDDTKIAMVVLPKDQKFEFPNIFPEKIQKKEKDQEKKTLDNAKRAFKQYLKKTEDRPGTPGWFSF